MNGELIPLLINASVVCVGQECEGWTLAGVEGGDGGGTREFVQRVEFERSFGMAPVVHVGLTGLDIDGSESARVSVGVGEVGPAGFDLVVRTWEYTRVYGVEVSWMAIGS